MEESEVFGQVFIRETCSDLANSLILFVVRVVNAKKEPTVATCAFALAEVTAHYNNVQRITDTVLEKIKYEVKVVITAFSNRLKKIRS
jgi:hypothetical protein